MRTAIVVLVSIWLVGGGVAAACDCGGSLEDGIARADVVFWGEIVATAPIADHGTKFTVEVRGVWKGSAKKRMVVVTDGSNCGLGGLKTNIWFLFVATERGTTLASDSCDGSQKATKEVRDDVTKILGAPRAPR